MTQLRVLSIGGGVQSTVEFEQSIDPECRGEPYDIYCFSNTHSEMPSTIENIERMKALCQMHGHEFVEVDSHLGPISDYYISKGVVPMPASAACTKKFKIDPIKKYLRGLVDESLPKPWIEMNLGITTDEAHRAKPNPTKYVLNRFPLIEKAMSRTACVNWLLEYRPGLNIKKSGCFHCHYQSPKSWAKLRREHPELFARAREMEEAARIGGEAGPVKDYGLFKGKSIAVFDHGGITLEDYGFTIDPGDVDCSATGGCFL